MFRVRTVSAAFALFSLLRVAPLHGVSIDVVGDGLTLGVADGDRARVVHTAPDAGAVPI